MTVGKFSWRGNYKRIPVRPLYRSVKGNERHAEVSTTSISRIAVEFARDPIMTGT